MCGVSSISIECYNCNGALWSSLRLLYDALRPSGILFVTKIHTNLVWSFADYLGFHSFLVFRHETQSTSGVRSLGGVAGYI